MRLNIHLSMRAQAALANLAAAGVIASVGVAAWGLGVRMMDGPGAVPAPVPPIARPAQAPPAASFHPFGVEQRSDAVPATSLPIELRGIIFSASEPLAAAYVSRAGAQPLAVRIGGDAGGGTILEIRRDHVLLRVGNRIERLSFPPVAGAAGTKRIGQPIPNPLPAGKPLLQGGAWGLPPHLKRHPN